MIKAISLIISSFEGANEGWNSIGKLAIYVMWASGFYLLINNGTFKNTLYFKLSIPFTIVTFFGFLFKIMHWTGANSMLLGSSVLIIVLYGISFLHKPKQNHLDVLKMLWVMVSFGFLIGIALRLNVRYIKLLSPMLLILCLFDFMYLAAKKSDVALDETSTIEEED